MIIGIIYNEKSEVIGIEAGAEVGFDYLSAYEKLSEDFIRKFKDKFDWRVLSYFQKLPEDLIREFKDKVDWMGVSVYQKLSEDFIEEFQDKVSWGHIASHQKVSKKFSEKFAYRTGHSRFLRIVDELDEKEPVKIKEEHSFKFLDIE
jgi:hypothetical protein